MEDAKQTNTTFCFWNSTMKGPLFTSVGWSWSWVIEVFNAKGQKACRLSFNHKHFASYEWYEYDRLGRLVKATVHFYPGYQGKLQRRYTYHHGVERCWGKSAGNHWSLEGGKIPLPGGSCLSWSQGKLWRRICLTTRIIKKRSDDGRRLDTYILSDHCKELRSTSWFDTQGRVIKWKSYHEGKVSLESQYQPEAQRPVPWMISRHPVSGKSEIGLQTVKRWERPDGLIEESLAQEKFFVSGSVVQEPQPEQKPDLEIFTITYSGPNDWHHRRLALQDLRERIIETGWYNEVPAHVWQRIGRSIM